MDLIRQVKENAKRNKQRIILPESYDKRILKAADIIIDEDIAYITLIGNKPDIERDSKKLNLKNIDKARIVDPGDNNKKEDYADLMVELRKSKGLTKDEAYKLLDNPLYLSTVMIKSGDADGEVAGAANATADVLKPALQFVKTKPGINVVSGAFMMILKDREFGQDGLLVFADCAVYPDPNAQELAEIAVATANTARAIAKIDPRVAMISFSTKGSAEHEMVDKVRNATNIARQLDSSLKIDGELQVDAALIKDIGEKKAPGSEIAGSANVLIFPNLESGNIAYKLVQRLAHAEAIGPILQGMSSPINDLSRGCSVDDIVNLVAITANQAMAE
ncbi:MAG: phosphate acetyltransferase [Bacteroidales bacterium]|nr:MAG: phosphate acetyltransferase [Bacteroidales bacterium]